MMNLTQRYIHHIGKYFEGPTDFPIPCPWENGQARVTHEAGAKPSLRKDHGWIPQLHGVMMTGSA